MADYILELKQNLEINSSYLKVHLSNNDISTNVLAFYLKLSTALLYIACKANGTIPERARKLYSRTNHYYDYSLPLSSAYIDDFISRALEITKNDAILSNEIIDEILKESPPLIVEHIKTTGSIEFIISLGTLLSIQALSQIDVKDLINLAAGYLRSFLAWANEPGIKKDHYFDDNTLKLLKEYDKIKIKFINSDGSKAEFDLQKKKK